MGGGSGISSLLFKSLFGFFGTLIVLGFILVMLVGALQTEGHKTKMALTADHRSSWSTGKLQQEVHVKVLGRGKSSVDLNMSKRRVPNGPDPIHNRRAGNSGRPPGRA
ncbi:hypothetical protein PTKIN_Ptkin17bG0072300 [Pterospermum kingtungense]